MNRKKKRTWTKYMMVFSLTFLITLILGGLLLTMLYVKQNEKYMQTSWKEESEETIRTQQTLEKTEEMEESTSVEETVQTKYGSVLQDGELMKQERIYTKEGKSEDEVTLVFGGDILFDDSYAIMSTYRNRGSDIKQAFSENLITYMQQADICMLNNEFPYTTQGTPLQGKEYTFRAKPENVSILQELGVDIVSLANNHASDYGEISLTDSLKTLDEANICRVGAGINLEDASHPVYFIVNDIKIAIVSATQIEQLDNPDTKGATQTEPGVFRCWNDDYVLDVLKEAKENSDFVIFYVHWGTESTTELNWGQTKYVSDYVNAGADVIIGDHPHVLQKIEVIDGTPVIYSVGNFWFNSKQRDTCMIEVKVDQNGLKSFGFVPCIQQNCTTTMVEGTEKTRIINYMNELSGKVLNEEGYLIF